MSADSEEIRSNGRINGDDSDGPITPEADMNGNGLEDDNDEDLFGDDDDEDQNIGTRPSQRKLDDEDLDSGDDEGRNDRLAATIEDNDSPQDQRPTTLVSADIARIKGLAEGDDLFFLNMPPYLGLKHRNYDSATYEPPTLPHDGTDPVTDPTRKFSAFSTATTSMYWKRDPKNPDLLQSNARIVKWSDGSLTLQLASRPTEQYRINTTSVRQRLKPGQSYDPAKDSHMYLGARHAAPGVDIQIVRPIDATMKIQSTGEQADESVLRLKESLAAQQSTHDPLARFKVVEEDPELAKKKAEEFEKEKARTLRKREAAEDRILSRRERVLGRSGVGGRGAGLSVAGLEDDDGMPSTRTKKRRKTHRSGHIYSDDEDSDAPRVRTREDEYDRDDGFVANSDEEPEVYDEDGDEEEEILAESDDPDRDDLEIEGRQTVIEDRTRGGAAKSSLKSKSKRSRMDEIEDDDEDDAEAEEDTEYLRGQSSAGAAAGAATTAGDASPGGAATGGRRRRVVSDDDDEDE